MNASIHSICGDLKNEGLRTKSPLAQIVATSWDDGILLDLRIAEILCSRNMAGIVYIAISGHHDPYMMHKDDLRSLAGMGFEVGEHAPGGSALPFQSGNSGISFVQQSFESPEQCLAEV